MQETYTLRLKGDPDLEFIYVCRALWLCQSELVLVFPGIGAATTIWVTLSSTRMANALPLRSSDEGFVSSGNHLWAVFARTFRTMNRFANPQGNWWMKVQVEGGEA